MPHHSPLVSTIVVGLVLAFAFGAVAHRFKASPLVGYLLAGVVIGPFTPGFVADQNIANELSEIGIILLMFGVGLQFSMHELLSVRAIAVPGALVQIAVATALGMALATALGWPLGAGLVFGVALSVASTVVVLRSLQERRLLDTERGRIAVGWLVVEDLAMVLVLVFLPALADLARGASVNLSVVAIPLAITLGKFAAFVVLMWLVGRRVIPWLLHYVAHTGSRELFRLAVLAIALGVAYGASTLFEVSFALGAFFAGMILSESTLSQRAAQETLPLRDAFAVLFFVSVGMLFNPAVILSHPVSLIATLLIIMVGKSAVAYFTMRLFRHSESTALMIAASRAQIGEFSFILAGLGVALGVLPPLGRDLILAAALLSILATPFLFVAADWIYAHHEPPKKEPAEAPAAPEPAETPTREPIPVTHLTNHVVLVGYGRVGSVIGAELKAANIPLFVTESDEDIVERLRKEGIEAIHGNAADPDLATAANYPAARCLLVAIPDGFEGGQVVEQARRLNPKLPIIARAHSDEEIEHLKRHGATKVIMGEQLIAHAMIEDARAAITPASPASSAAPPTTAPIDAATAQTPQPT
ncbi:MAG: monovalent cation:H+ antiporter-2, family [Hyphomicrobiales bacterium]|nr:monovalent cation:H+ antiporter-2, family [Hyphomicrobiales bacterium]